MFTGLVEDLGRVSAVHDEPPGKRLVIASRLADGLTVGDSVAINGVCLTIVAVGTAECAFQAGPETLARTNLGALKPGEVVNVERSLRLGDQLGGHLVQGHVDAVGRILERTHDGEWETVWFSYPPDLGPQLAPKGSVAVDGVSLTVVEVRPGRFSVALIPHTLERTTLGRRAVGDVVNLETDVLAKYVARQFAASEAPLGGSA